MTCFYTGDMRSQQFSINSASCWVHQSPVKENVALDRRLLFGKCQWQSQVSPPVGPDQKKQPFE